MLGKREIQRDVEKKRQKGMLRPKDLRKREMERDFEKERAKERKKERKKKGF